jgi:hypothetical protein
MEGLWLETVGKVFSGVCGLGWATRCGRLRSTMFEGWREDACRDHGKDRQGNSRFSSRRSAAMLLGF